MNVSVSGTIDQKMYLKKFRGGFSALSPPWIRLWWSYVSFKGSVKVPRFFRRNDFLLQYVDVSLCTFLDHRAAFRFQVDQLVVQEVECG